VVVDSAYLVLKEEPSSRAADAATARRSEILEMTSRVRAKDAKGTERLWYGLAKCGKTLWAEAEGLALYDSLEKARTAVEPCADMELLLAWGLPGFDRRRHRLRHERGGHQDALPARSRKSGSFGVRIPLLTHHTPQPP
jgi:hypothetical protein